MKIGYIKNWDEYFYEMVELVASKSKDNSVQVGAIIVNDFNHVVCTGYNGFPRGVEETEERKESPEKYNWVVHAEHNAILQAANLGIQVRGLDLYTQWLPCSDCAKAIIQAGIKNVYYFHPAEHFLEIRQTPVTDKWTKSHEVTKLMLLEAGVNYEQLDIKNAPH